MDEVTGHCLYFFIKMVQSNQSVLPYNYAVMKSSVTTGISFLLVKRSQLIDDCYLCRKYTVFHIRNMVPITWEVQGFIILKGTYLHNFAE